jgi:hypothetical protein
MGKTWPSYPPEFSAEGLKSLRSGDASSKQLAGELDGADAA